MNSLLQYLYAEFIFDSYKILTVTLERHELSPMQQCCLANETHISTNHTIDHTHSTVCFVVVNLVCQGIWSGGQNFSENVVQWTEFSNFVHTEISPGLRNLVRTMIIHDSIIPA